MKAAIRIYLIITLGLIAFVDVQMIAGPIRDKRLFGVLLETKKVPFAFSSLFRGTFQVFADQWISENMGFKGYLIRLENQVNYWVFKELSSTYSTRVTLCNDKQLFEKVYLNSYNRLDIISIEKLKEKVESIKRLQNLLNQRNINFLFIITPSKAEIHPEYIPDRYIIQSRLDLTRNYENIIPLLNKHGIKYLDGHEFFMNLKKNVKYDLYPNTGIHWGFYSSYLFTCEMIRKLRLNSGLNLPEIKLGRIKTQSFPVTPDDDMLKLSNLMYPKLLYTQYCYPITFVNANCRYFLPRLLFEGGSFINSIIYYTVRHRSYSECEHLFYYNEMHRYEKNTITEVSGEAIDSGERNGFEKLKKSVEIFRRNKANLREVILNKDIVILEANEQALSNIGSGFVEDAIAALEDDNGL